MLLLSFTPLVAEKAGQQYNLCEDCGFKTPGCEDLKHQCDSGMTLCLHPWH